MIEKVDDILLFSIQMKNNTFKSEYRIPPEVETEYNSNLQQWYVLYLSRI